MPHPGRMTTQKAKDFKGTMRSLLAELGAADTPMFKVLNKCDLVPGLRPRDRKDTVLISARE